MKNKDLPYWWVSFMLGTLGDTAALSKSNSMLSLERYEEALANCKYEDGDLFTVPGRSPYQKSLGKTKKCSK